VTDRRTELQWLRRAKSSIAVFARKTGEKLKKIAHFDDLQTSIESRCCGTFVIRHSHHSGHEAFASDFIGSLRQSKRRRSSIKMKF